MTRLGRGELEQQVLLALWAADRPCTPRDVHSALAADRPLAYTTVTTILVRLWQKGLLAREAAGRGYAYEPIETQDQRVASRMRELLAGAHDRASALTGFVSSLSPTDQASLRHLLDDAP